VSCAGRARGASRAPYDQVTAGWWARRAGPWCSGRTLEPCVFLPSGLPACSLAALQSWRRVRWNMVRVCGRSVGWRRLAIR